MELCYGKFKKKLAWLGLLLYDHKSQSQTAAKPIHVYFANYNINHSISNLLAHYFDDWRAMKK